MDKEDKTQTVDVPAVAVADPSIAASRKHERPLDFGFIPIPSWNRYDPSQPREFSLLLNMLFGLSCTFSVANLYYCQPLLIQFARSFDVSDGRVARIPTLLQAGYVAGLLLLTPMGDLIRRRPLILASVFVSASLTIGLAVTSSVDAFEALSFLVGFCTIASPILIPLAADLAPPERRASAMSIVFSGYLLGIVIARVIAGIIAEFASWRIVYFMAIGVQYALCVALYLMVPDYPPKSKDMTYFGILWSMAKLAVTEPRLIQTYLIFLASDACYIDFWVTLTFILGQSPYHYSTLVIGLFGLIGLFGVSMAPFTGRFIDGLVPWHSALLGTLLMTVFWVVQTAAAGVSMAAIVVVCLGLDYAITMQQLSLMASVLSIDEAARSRMNSIMILSNFAGQLIGVPTSTKVYVEHGWRAAAGYGLGCMGLQLFFLLPRGPHCKRYTWFGYEGGLDYRRNSRPVEAGESHEIPEIRTVAA
ncbi:MFS general substrate transporter [Dentipellis sp. KUC8613]|nr:MFS general substrate transporter [Dentipellis sp. KUC8613]